MVLLDLPPLFLIQLRAWFGNTGQRTEAHFGSQLVYPVWFRKSPRSISSVKLIISDLCLPLKPLVFCQIPKVGGGAC